MTNALLLAITQNIAFIWRLLRAIPSPNPVHAVLRVVLFPLLWLGLCLLTCVHFICFLLDELFFPRYRKVKPSKPLFIVGIPRSGTTWLQRVLAKDPQSTTLTLAEAVFAPSITQRYVLCGLKQVLRPVANLFAKLPFEPLKTFDAVHKIRFSEPEEDFLLLVPLHACFLFTVLCPRSEPYWDLARFDTTTPDKKKNVILQYYMLCVKKHLFFHGEQLTFVSKNPSFTPFIAALKETFSDANIVACTRSPLETVPSQLASLTPIQELIGSGIDEHDFRERMVDVLLDYYGMIAMQKESTQVVEMHALQHDLQGTVKKLYSSFDKVMNPVFTQEVQLLSEKGKAYKSQHTYNLSKFHLAKDDIETKFAQYWAFETDIS